MEVNEIEHKVLCFSFNSDSSCLIVGTTEGFGIYDCSDFQLKYRAAIGGVGLCQMLGRSNIVALVGAGENPEFPQKKLILYNTKKNNTYCEFFYETEKILNLKIDSFILTVATAKSLYVYNFPKVENFKTISVKNPNGHLDVSASDNPILVVANQVTDPVTNKIDYQVNLYDVPDLTGSKPQDPISHRVLSNPTEISYIRINSEGTLLAVAHTEGTIINVHRIPKMELLVSFHRGINAAKIYSLNFSFDSCMLLCTSNRGTMHIFDVQSNTRSIQGALMNMFKRITSGTEKEKQTSILSKEHERKCIFKAAFTKSSKLIYVFDEEGYFTEIRQGDDKKFSNTDSLKADELLR